MVNSTELYIGEGAIMSVGMDVVNEGKLINNGKVHLQKNLENQNSLSSTGVMVFDGNDKQVIKGSKELSLGQVMIENDIKLEVPLRINELASFRRGVIESNSLNPLIFAEKANHNGISDFSHAKGVVKKEGNESFEFPLGDGSNLRSFNVANANESQILTAEYVYRSPMHISGEVSEEVEAIDDTEYWSLRSASTKGSAKVSVNQESDLNEIAFLKRGTWEMTNDAKLSSTTDLSNGTLFTLAKSKSVKAAIGVYPNPTEGEFNLKLSGMNDSEKISVDIVNQDGTRLLHKEGTVKELRRVYQLPSSLPATELTVRVLRGENSMTEKMILKK
jgi:hypothetical protein